MGVADGVLELIELFDAALRHVLRDTKGKRRTVTAAGKSGAVEGDVVELGRRIGDGLRSSGELRVDACLGGAELIEQVWGEDVGPDCRHRARRRRSSARRSREGWWG